MGKSERDIPRQRNADVQPTESVQVRPRTERRFRRRHRRGAEHPHVGKYSWLEMNILSVIQGRGFVQHCPRYSAREILFTGPTRDEGKWS